jgi:hypothetical protein
MIVIFQHYVHELQPLILREQIITFDFLNNMTDQIKSYIVLVYLKIINTIHLYKHILFVL